MKQPTIEELEDALSPIVDVSAFTDCAKRADTRLRSTQAMLDLMRDIEAGKVKVVPCDHVTDEMRNAMRRGYYHRECFADTFITTAKAAPDMLAGYWGDEG